MSREMNALILVTSVAFLVASVSFVIYDTQANLLVSLTAIVTAISLALLIAQVTYLRGK